MASQMPPTPSDWRVTVWYRGWDGKDRKRSIAVATVGDILTEAQAVDRALNSLRKSLMEKMNGKPTWDWALPPKVYDVKAECYFKDGTVKTQTKYEQLLARFKATA